jgi:hypothetical protein
VFQAPNHRVLIPVGFLDSTDYSLLYQTKKEPGGSLEYKHKFIGGAYRVISGTGGTDLGVVGEELR